MLTHLHSEKMANVPKGISECLVAIGSNQIDEQAIKALPAQSRKKAMAALDYHVKKEPGCVIAAEYKAAANDMERRACLAKYMVTASDAKKTVTNTSSISYSKKRKGAWKWVHLSTLSGPNYVNDREVAEGAVADLEHRPSQYKRLAAKGLKEYWYLDESESKGTEVLDKAAVEAVAELDDDTFEQVKDCMQSEMDRGTISLADAPPAPTTDPSGVKKRAGKRAELDTPAITDGQPQQIEEEKLIATAADRLIKAKSDLIAIHSRATKELARVAMIEVRLKGKPGWGESACVFIREKTDLQLELAKTLHERWVQATVFTDGHGELTIGMVAAYDAESLGLEKAATEFEIQYNTYVKVDLGDFAKLRS